MLYSDTRYRAVVTREKIIPGEEIAQGHRHPTVLEDKILKNTEHEHVRAEDNTKDNASNMQRSPLSGLVTTIAQLYGWANNSVSNDKVST